MNTPILDPSKVPADWTTDVFGLVYPKSVWDWTQVRPIEWERDVTVFTSPNFEGSLSYVLGRDRDPPELVEMLDGFGVHADGTPMSKEEISDYLVKWVYVNPL